MATAAQVTEFEVFRSPFYDPRGVARSFIRSIGDGWYRRFEVSQAGGTVREVDVCGSTLDPRLTRLADERAASLPDDEDEGEE